MFDNRLGEEIRSLMVVALIGAVAVVAWLIVGLVWVIQHVRLVVS